MGQRSRGAGVINTVDRSNRVAELAKLNLNIVNPTAACSNRVNLERHK